MGMKEEKNHRIERLSSLLSLLIFDAPWMRILFSTALVWAFKTTPENICGYKK